MILLFSFYTMTTTKRNRYLHVKRMFYLFCTVLLCISFISLLTEIVTTAYLNYSIAHDSIPTRLGLLELIWLLACGWCIFGGIALGKIWWRILYIEKRRPMYGLLKGARAYTALDFALFKICLISMGLWWAAMIPQLIAVSPRIYAIIRLILGTYLAWKAHKK